jgi:predicted DCC family thiol-disulfide oxidoreductase YuxK
MSGTTTPPRPVLLFDGECGLCQRIVRLILQWDRTGRIHFAPLQGPSAQQFLASHGLPVSDFDSLVWVPDWHRRANGDFLLRSAGALAALRACGRPSSRILAAALGIFPAVWRDRAYRLVARIRFRVFGRGTPRPLRHPEWSTRFIT